MSFWIDPYWYRSRIEEGIKVLNVSGKETGNYDPATCRNGGGYWQMRGSCFVRSGNYTFYVETNDDSCGDFFTEQSVKIFPMDALDYPNYNFIWDDSGKVVDSYGVVDYWWFTLHVDLMAVINAALRSTYDAAYDAWWEEHN